MPVIMRVVNKTAEEEDEGRSGDDEGQKG